jgi:hypothetical protein
MPNPSKLTIAIIIAALIAYIYIAWQDEQEVYALAQVEGY